MVLSTRSAARSSLLYSRGTCMRDENATNSPVVYHFGTTTLVTLQESSFSSIDCHIPRIITLTMEL